MQLSDGTRTVALPQALLWKDEWDWEPVVVATEFSLTGSLIVEQAERLTGRPITLDTHDGAWLDRATLDALRTLDPASAPWQLSGLKDSVLSVVPASDWISAQPVFHDATRPPGQQFTAQLQFIEV